MLVNLLPRSELIGFARRNAKKQEIKRITLGEQTRAVADGWEVLKSGKKTAQIARNWRRAEHLEARVWTVFYRMGFDHLNGKGGCRLPMNLKDPASPQDQLHVVAVDGEVAIAVECKSADEPRKDADLPRWMARFGEMKRRFADAVRLGVPSPNKRHVALVVFTWDIVLSDNDRARAEEHGVQLFDLADLEYFEALVGHLGPAARYQFLAELFRGMPIHGLEVRVPALRTKVGRSVSYTFSIRPEYLLKIAYVAHRAKGKAIDVDMYQRMVSRSRLKKIADFISEGGNFPTNVVINVRERRYVEFARGEQLEADNGALFGWLTLRPAYGCAWVIDGQHRLFAYSGHEAAGKAFLNVLAHEALSASEQAQMFVDINSEQRKVKRSLLVELDADLKWNAEEEDDRIQAIISKAGLALDEQLDSPLRGRILLADVKRTDQRCVSLTAVSTALSRTGFFVTLRKRDHTEYGPLWRPDPHKALSRTIAILKAWLGTVTTTAADWWALGAGAGGGLAMNNGVTVIINMLRSVMEHLGSDHLRALDTDDLIARLDPYAKTLGAYFARMTAEERERFRELQGVDGQNTGTRQCQEALSREHTKYAPADLLDWLERRKKNYNDEGRAIIEEIESLLQRHVLQTLKSEFDTDEADWWWEGIPKNVRKKVDDRMNEAEGRPGTREQNFDLIHYREIVTYQWELFKDVVGRFEAGNGKDKQTAWIKEVGDMRNIVMHPSRQQFLTVAQIQALQTYITWLRGNLRKLESGISSDEGASQPA